MKIHVQSLHKNRLFAGWVKKECIKEFSDGLCTTFIRNRILISSYRQRFLIIEKTFKEKAFYDGNSQW